MIFILWRGYDYTFSPPLIQEQVGSVPLPDHDHHMAIRWSLYDNMMIIIWQDNDHHVTIWWSSNGVRMMCTSVGCIRVAHWGRMEACCGGARGPHSDTHTPCWRGWWRQWLWCWLLCGRASKSQIHIIVPCFKNICFWWIWWKRAITVQMSFFSSTFEMCSIHA